MMIYVFCRGRAATAQTTEPITSGSAGVEATFQFDDSWEGFAKTSVWKGSGQTVDVALIENTCTVPDEVLAESGGKLRVGVYGTDGTGARRTPTVWTEIGTIQDGAEPSGIEPTPQTASLVEQLLAAAQAARNAAAAAEALAQGVRDDADAGEFDGESAYAIAVAHGFEGTEAEWLASLHGRDATVDATLSNAGQAADAAETGRVRRRADYALRFAETLNGGGAPPLDAAWEPGGMSANGGDYNSQTYRARTADSLSFAADTSLQAAEGYQLFAVIWNPDGTKKESTAWVSAKTVAAGDRVRICVRRNPEDTALAADPEDFGAAIRIRNNIGGGAAALSGYATEQWVGQQGFLTAHQDISGKLNRDQGAANAGKILVVGSDGILAPVTMSAWQGGSY